MLDAFNTPVAVEPFGIFPVRRGSPRVESSISRVTLPRMQKVTL